jgi:hypothetical protein
LIFFSDQPGLGRNFFVPRRFTLISAAGRLMMKAATESSGSIRFAGANGQRIC